MVFKPISDIPTIWIYSGADFYFFGFFGFQMFVIIVFAYFLLCPRCCIWKLVAITWESQWYSKEDCLCLWQTASVEALALPDHCEPNKGARWFKIGLVSYEDGLFLYSYLLQEYNPLRSQPIQTLYSLWWALNANFYAPTPLLFFSASQSCFWH